MNREMKTKLMMMVAAVAVTFGAWADTETVGDYTWTYQINGDTAEIRNGSSVAISPNPTGAVTIPSTPDEHIGWSWERKLQVGQWTVAFEGREDS